MKKKLIICSILLIGLLVFNFQAVFAQDYYFSVDKYDIKVFINENGTASIDYTFHFTNAPGAHIIDYVDVGLPNSSYNRSSLTADVNGVAVDVSAGEYAGDGTGVAVVLGSQAIKPGQSGVVHVFIGGFENLLYPGTGDEAEDYASFQFAPTWFGKQYVSGNTDMTFTLYLPPNIQPEEPRYYIPEKWPGAQEPESGINGDGLIFYRWRSTDANAYTKYTFGAGFPVRYVPEDAIVTQASFVLDEDAIICGCFSLFFLAIIGGTIYAAVWGSKKRKMKYLPPKIAIEGHGIKRGLTAIEAAILMEQPMDKILTMILFSVIRKEAASVIKQDPIELEISSPLPEKLRWYELDFLKAFEEKDKGKRRRALQEMMADLVNRVTKKMKGFSRKETVAFYKSIMERAWEQVEGADTPEVQMQKFDEVMDWTLLDKDFDDRTQTTFGRGPVVYAPRWWGRYDPGFGRSSSMPSSKPVASSQGGGRTVSLPHLPGSDFAASMTNGMQAFAAGVVGDLTSFTSRVTNKTNPVPKTSSGSYRSGGSGGSSCACACACAGCACACAGGGR
jgi:hypothetical protein